MSRIATLAATVAVLAALGAAAPVRAAGESVKLKSVDWSFSGVFGTYDRAQLQRGMKIYLEVCSSCHGLRLVSYRNLAQIGLTLAEIKRIAGEKTKQVINDEGDAEDKPREPNDRFARPFPNDQAAKAANNGAVPPDLSLIVKARLGGANYIYSLLTGYVSAEECSKQFKDYEGNPLKPAENQHCNAVFPGHILAMAPPLNSEGQVEYTAKDAPKATVDQMSKDVSAFLVWAARPHMEDRKRMGWKAILFLLLLTAVLYGIYRKVWRDVH